MGAKFSSTEIETIPCKEVGIGKNWLVVMQWTSLGVKLALVKLVLTALVVVLSDQIQSFHHDSLCMSLTASLYQLPGCPQEPRLCTLTSER